MRSIPHVRSRPPALLAAVLLLLGAWACGTPTSPPALPAVDGGEPPVDAGTTDAGASDAGALADAGPPLMPDAGLTPDAGIDCGPVRLGGATDACWTTPNLSLVADWSGDCSAFRVEFAGVDPSGQALNTRFAIAPPWSTTFDLSGRPTGEYTFVATRIDRDGARSQSAVHRARLNPQTTLYWTSPHEFADPLRGVVRLRVAPATSEPGIHAALFLDGRPVIGATPAVGGVVTFDWDTAQHTYGAHRLEVSVPGCGPGLVTGIVIAKPTLTCRIESCAGAGCQCDAGQCWPDFQARAHVGSVRLRGAFDFNEPIARVDFKVDGAAVGSAAAPTFTLDFATEALTTGTHTVECVAVSHAGESLSDTVEARVADPCDLDGDGVRGSQCGGPDCNDRASPVGACGNGAPICQSGACTCTGVGPTDTCALAGRGICDQGACRPCLTARWVYQPTTLEGHTAVYDPLGARTLVVGGRTDHSGGDYGRLNRSLWSITEDAAGAPTWRDIELVGETPRLESGSSSVLFDVANRRIVAYATSLEASPVSEVWTLDVGVAEPLRWVQHSLSGPPPARYYTHFVYDSNLQQAILFSGYLGGATAESAEVWALSLAANEAPRWRRLGETTALPSSRDAVAVYHPEAARILLLPRQAPLLGPAGVSALHVGPDDRLFVASVATQGTLPVHFIGASYVHDPIGQRVLAFVPFGHPSPIPEVRPAQEVWALSLPTSGPSAWTQLPIAQPAPRPRLGATATLDPATRRVRLLGGLTPDREATGDHWSLTLPRGPAAPVWRQHAPSARQSHTLTYDPDHRQALLVGGFDAEDYRLISGDSVMALSLRGSAPTWARVVTSGELPPALAEHTTVYDTRNRQFIVLGGLTDPVSPSSTVWRLTMSSPTSGTWSRLDLGETGPPPLQSHAAVYDPVEGRMWVFGDQGRINESEPPFVWVLNLPPGASPYWERQATAGGHVLRGGYYEAAYDPAADRIIVAGPAVWETGADLLSLSRRTSGGLPTWSATLPPAGSELPASWEGAMIAGIGTVFRCSHLGSLGPLHVQLLTTPPSPAQWRALDDGLPTVSRPGPGVVFDPAFNRLVTFWAGLSSAVRQIYLTPCP